MHIFTLCDRQNLPVCSVGRNPNTIILICYALRNTVYEQINISASVTTCYSAHVHEAISFLYRYYQEIGVNAKSAPSVSACAMPDR